MASDGVPGARPAGNRGSNTGFEWVSSSPSPATVSVLEARFPEVVQIPSSVLDSSIAGWKDNAVLARTLQRWIPPEAFIREFRRVGISGNIQAVCLAHRCYIFRFDDCIAKESVACRPWVVNGQPVAMENWRPEFIPAEDSIPSALIWVRLPSLPMEFWSEEALAAILEPAGQFVCVDPATRALSRGAFARACVRLDLRQPLRPGVRVQGLHSPFWQQFQYEHMAGICPNCGSIHLSGPCSLSSPGAEPESSSASSLFGPWMAATRRRVSPASARKKTAKDAGSPSSVPVQQATPASGPGPASEGWIVPVKVARRRSLKFGSSGGGVSTSQLSSLGAGVEGSVCAKGPVPVGITVGSSVSVLKSEVQNTLVGSLDSGSQMVVAKNPFGSLGVGSGDCCPTIRPDVNPGPSKRARPEDSSTQRIVTKGGKRKGKVSSASSSEPKEKLSLTIPESRSKASGSVSLGSMLAPATNSSTTNDRSHNSILSCLKLAMKDQSLDTSVHDDSTPGMNSLVGASSREDAAIQIECMSQAVGVLPRAAGSSSELSMMVDQGVTHPPLN